MTERLLGRLIRWGIVGGMAATGTGCAVGQTPGRGQMLHVQEPVHGAGYWLYLPEDYVKNRGPLLTNRRWPLVVTFHGMKPFDNANPQAREWQQEADRYGFIVCAPELRTPDLLYEFPFRHISPSLLRDEENTIAILDHLVTTTDADPNAVLSTSWSSGGYLAHYMVNRHPDRFSCLAVRQSNFSADILDPSQVPEYQDHKIAVFFTEHDFAVCKQESQAAAQWYSRHGFDLTFAKLSVLGHERTPSVAAAFFARTCAAAAKTPPTELARMQVKEMPIEPEQAAVVAAAMTSFNPPDTAGVLAGGPPGTRSRAPEATVASSPFADAARTDRPRPSRESSPPRDAGVRPASGPAPRSGPDAKPIATTPVPPPRSAKPSPKRAAPETPPVETSPVRVRLSSTIGVAPLLISYSAVMPGPMRRGAYFLWTDNGEPISNGVNGQKFLTEPGEHRLEVLVTASDGKEYRAGQTVVVLEPIVRNKSGG